MSEELDEETIERRSQNADATFGCFLDAWTYGCLPLVMLILAAPIAMLQFRWW